MTDASVSAFPAGAPWLPKTDEGSALSPDVPADTSPASPDTAKADLADLLKRHDDDIAAEQQSFNHRLASLLNDRRELPANDRRRLNALLAELLEHRDDGVAGEPEGLPASVIVSFDRAMDGIVKSLNEHSATTRKSSIVPGQSVNGQ